MSINPSYAIDNLKKSSGTITTEKCFKTEIQFGEYSSEDDNEAKTPIISIFKPPETGVICGYITNKFTGEPIENARVYLYCDDHYINNTFSNYSGFYYMNTPAGYVSLEVGANGYRWDYTFNCGYIGDNETKWKNISKIPYPPFNSIICGYVTDEITNEPIENVYCKFFWNYYGLGCYRTTFNDINGFYQINVPAIEDWYSLSFETDYYYPLFTGGGCIEENETIWKNVSLYPRPLENSVVCGYVKGFRNHEPIKGAEIIIFWNDTHGDNYYEAITNEYGFFTINIPAGYIECYIYKEGYRAFMKNYYKVEENATLWINCSLFKSKNKIASYNLFNFLEQFPNAFKILRFVIRGR